MVGLSPLAERVWRNSCLIRRHPICLPITCSGAEQKINHRGHGGHRGEMLRMTDTALGIYILFLSVTSVSSVANPIATGS